MKRKKTKNYTFILFCSLPLIVLILFIYMTFRSDKTLSDSEDPPVSDHNVLSDPISELNNKNVSENRSLSVNETEAVSESMSDSESESASESASAPNAIVSSAPASSISAASITISSNRVTYQEGFYYEDITETLKERINGLSYKADCTVPYEDLRYLSVKYINFEGTTETGELICSKLIADDLLEIFYELYLAAYPIEKIRLIDEYQADDDLSCADNNTSCFNYRVVEGSKKLSKHALGLAIDINPVYNPYVTYPNGEIRITPIGSELYADRSLDFPHKISESDLCYQLFVSHGFTWGGSWNTLKDYQHFQKSS